jgi:serine protease Do
VSGRGRGLLAAALFIGGCRARSTAPQEAPPVTSAAPSAAPSVYAVGSAEAPPAALAPSTFADLAARADPAVVFIETEQAMYGRGKRIVAGGVGTGFVFDASGLILTNDHVVANATRIDVVFGEEERKRATVIGSDTPTDVAVLRIEGHAMKSLPLGDSDRIRVGDWVVAIGNPFSLSHTVSAGILSAKGRTKSDVKGLDPSGFYDYLQTDASINPGNSGGPLLDLTGRVIGINTAIKPEANSIGFAIPINMVRELLPTLIEHGKVARSAMGIWVASVKDEDMSRLSLPNKAGSLVTRVNPASAGAQAGLAVDDVILAFEASSSVGPNRLRWLTSIAGIGKKVRLKVQRGQKILYPSVVLSPAPEAEESGSRPSRGKDDR